MMDRAVLMRIIEQAKWAPSGDNTQPWRFKIIHGDSLIVYGHDTRDHCLYDFQGHPSHIALGALLENIGIAAASEGWTAQFDALPKATERTPVICVTFKSGAQIDHLIHEIQRRSVNRRRYRLTPLTQQQRDTLAMALTEGYQVRWYDSWQDKCHMAHLNSLAGRLRLRLPETYPVHRDIVQWNARWSPDKVPDQAIGLDPLTLKLMHWVMNRWERVDFMNKWMGGTWLPRLELDILPSLFCASHFAILCSNQPTTWQHYVESGRHIQRFWLTVSQLGLQLQPEMSSWIFASYAQQGLPLSSRQHAMTDARQIRTRFETYLQCAVDHVVFVGRVGVASMPRARSTRRQIWELMSNDSEINL